MKQSLAFTLWTMVWTWSLLPLAAAVKFTPDPNTANISDDGLEPIYDDGLDMSYPVDQSNQTDLQLALLSRSARVAEGNQRTNSSRELALQSDLDAAVAQKGISIVGDFFTDVVDTAGGALSDVADAAGNAIKTAAEVTVDTLKEAGMAVGSAAANAAVVIGTRIVKTAITQITALPGHIKTAADAIGDAAMTVGNAVQNVGEMVADTTVNLAGEVLQRAQAALNEGVKLAEKVGQHIADAAAIIGDGVVKVGHLAAGLAKAAWEQIKEFVNCLLEQNLLCYLMIGSHCDCAAGSHVTPSTSGVTLRCVVSKVGEFGGSYGLSAVASGSFGSSSDGSTMILPGNEWASAYKTANQVMKSRNALKPAKAKAPTGSCEAALSVAVEGAAQFTPDITVSMGFDGDTEISISGTVRSSLDALVEGEGSCSFRAERGLPKIPKKKVICIKAFCIVLMFQFIAELEIKGVLTGTVEIASDMEYQVKGKVTVNKAGRADAHFESPAVKNQNSFAVGASAQASIRVGMGPVFTVWPVPGIPITFNAMINAEAKAMGTLSYRSNGGLFLLEDVSNVSLDLGKTLIDERKLMGSTIDMCGAAVLMAYADIDITGFALPRNFRAVMSSKVIEDAIEDAILKGAKAMLGYITGPARCIPGADKVESVITEAAKKASSAIRALIPDLRLDFSAKSIQLLEPQKLWCEEVYKTPGFATAPCAATLGCKHAGRPHPRGEEPPPPEQVSNHLHTTGHAATCHQIHMGDRFIALSHWRLADIDGTHFSISHSSGWTAYIFRSDGLVFNGPRRDFGAWGRPVGASKGISFGFQFVQIGKFRLGAIDNTHLSIAHSGGKTAVIFRSDAGVFTGPRSDYTAFDRGEGAPMGISFGNSFIQLGLFRVGANDGNHFVVTHTNGHMLQMFRGDGQCWHGLPHCHSHPGHHWANAVNGRQPVAWTCKDLAEMAFGACDPDFGAFGDRFIQLGNFRLAAIDETHFSVSHKLGQTIEIYRSDATTHVNNNVPFKRYDYGSWSKPVGFPHGITFGPGFIQLGNFRIGAIDDKHLSLAHKDHTLIIWRSDDTTHNGPRSDWTAWKQSAGPAAGVTFGDRFIQLGNFRLGAVDGNHFVIGHRDGAVHELYRSDGLKFPGVGASWSHRLWERYPQWHCGGIQEIFGNCPGVVAGDDFLQFGDWRMAAIDASHFSISHRGGKTAILYRWDGATWENINDWGSWHRETKQSHETYKIKFGDRFIQFGAHWRLGEVSHHLTLAHSQGHAVMIYKHNGEIHAGHKRWQWSPFRRPAVGAPKGVTFGDRFVQIGGFRIGDVDSTHFSIAHSSGHTATIFRSDGTQHKGPRTSWTTFGRQLADCAVV